MWLTVRMANKYLLAALLGSSVALSGLQGAFAQENGFQLDSQGLDIAEERLAEAEARLLQKISDGDAAPKAEQRPPKVETHSFSDTAPAKEEPKAGLSRDALRVSVGEQKKKRPPKVIGGVSQEIAGEVESLHGQNTSLKNKMRFQNRSIRSLETSNSGLKDRLRASEARVAQLLGKLKQMRNDLIVAETEVERLSHIIDERNQTTLSRYSGKSRSMPATVDHKNYLLNQKQQEKADSKMEIATVQVRKANLRTGPGKNLPHKSVPSSQGSMEHCRSPSCFFHALGDFRRSRHSPGRRQRSCRALRSMRDH